MRSRLKWMFAVLLAAPAHAASEPGIFSVLFENDVFYDTDRDYTNGVEFAYTTPPHDDADTVVDIARILPIFADTGRVRTNYALGQNIFTPADTQLFAPPPNERPYAGYLYGAVGLLEENDTRLDQLQLQLGVVGPASLAADAQKWVHSILGQAKPQGWHAQLRDEPALNIQYERSLKVIPPQSLLGLVLDIEPHWGLEAGTVYDYVNIGAMVRFGFNLPEDFGPLRIDPSLPGSSFFEATGDFSAYVFAGVDGRAVARNIFLDGNTWRASPSVVKKNLVGDLELGAAVTFERARLTFTHVFRSREYATQTSSDQFGAVSLSFEI
ncbi:MAG: lipid A deacylase LpxR family protein [Alphaproteobacteria bacterium]|nr:lipid A deacylase LpxR family protein [Alphaproteobacteria bacterium]